MRLYGQDENFQRLKRQDLFADGNTTLLRSETVFRADTTTQPLRTLFLALSGPSFSRAPTHRLPAHSSHRQLSPGL